MLSRLRALPPDDAAVEEELRGITDEVLAELGLGGGDGAPPGVSGAAESADSARLETLIAGVPAFSVGAHWRRLLELGGADVRRQLALVCWLQLFQQATGINVILYYAAELYQRAGVPADIAATWCVVANAALLVLGTVPGMLLVDRQGVGRRILLLAGAAAMTVFLCAATGLIVVSQSGAAAASYGAVASLWCFTIAFSSSWGPVVWVLQSEVLPLRYRAQGSAVGTLCNWSANAIIGRFTPVLLQAAGPYSYLLFAAFCIVMGGYVAFFVPETAGVSLEHMAGLFGAPPARSKLLLAAGGDADAAVAASGGDDARLVRHDAAGSVDTRPLTEEEGV